MRICIVTHKLLRTDGQGRVNYELAQYLLNSCHQVDLVATDVDPALVSQPRLTWHPVPIPAWVPSALLRNQVFALQARNLLKQHSVNADIVHLNGSITYQPADVNTCHFVHSNWLKSSFHPAHTGKGLNAFYQWVYTKLNALWEYRAYRSSRFVVAISNFVRDSLITDLALNPSQLVVIPNGIDTAEFSPLQPGEPNQLKNRLQLTERHFLIFFTGDIRSNRKNLDLVIQALPDLNDHIHLAVAGALKGSPYPDLAQTLNIKHRVHFLGHRADLPQLLPGADAFVLPAHYDPYALVVLEAMASRIPVITVPSVGISSLIQNGQNGFVLQSSQDQQGLVAALQDLAANPELAQRIANAGYLTAQSLSWQAMAQQYEALYNRALESKQPGHVWEQEATSKQQLV